MNLFLDSADARSWTLPAGCPAMAGVTTNPTLVHQAGRPVSLPGYLALVSDAIAAQVPHLMLQLPTPDVDEGLAWLDALVDAAGSAALQLTFKLPCQADWAPLLQAVQGRGQSTLLTGLSNPVQLLWAQQMRADYVAPYLGRLLTDGRDAWALMEACVAVQRAPGPKLLAASVKTADAFARLLALGADAVTVRPEFVTGLASDPLTRAAITQFETDRKASLKG